MNSWKTKQGYEIFQILSGRSNSYLISTGTQNILIDTGKKSAYRKLKQNIELLKLTNKISFLILTHTHYDHCQNVNVIKDQENCKVFVSLKAKESIENGYTVLPKGTMIIPKLISKIGRMIAKKRFGYKTFMPDIFINKDVDLNDYHLDIKLIETSGHSADSISVIIDNEIAVVGDAMFGVFKNSIMPPFADNTEEMRN